MALYGALQYVRRVKTQNSMYIVFKSSFLTQTVLVGPALMPQFAASGRGHHYLLRSADVALYHLISLYNRNSMAQTLVAYLPCLTGHVLWSL